MNNLSQYVSNLPVNLYSMLQIAVRGTLFLFILKMPSVLAAPSALKSLDLQMTESQQTELRLQLSQPLTRVESYQISSPPRLIVDLFDTENHLPQKKLHFNRALVQSVTGVQAGTRTRLIINLNQTAFFQTRTEGNRVSLIIGQPVTAKQVKKRASDSDKTLSLNFQNINIRSALQIIAEETGLNLVTSDKVQGTVTLRLKQVPWDQALKLVMESKGLASRKDGNVLIVAPAEELAERERKELASLQEHRDLADLSSELIQINYAKSSDIAAILNGHNGGPGLLSKRGKALADARTNTLLLQEIPDAIKNIRNVIRTLDIPVPQVLIEARIVVARSNLSSDLGIRWSGVSSQGQRGIGSGDLAVDLTARSGGYANINPGAGTFALGYADSSILVDMELAALASEGKGEIISQPKVITANKRKALIKSGKQIPYREESSSGGTKVSFKDAVLALEVTPQITPDKHIIMDLQITQDALGNQEYDGAPAIDTNAIETQVLVNNGETIVLGGIYTSESFDQNFKVPLLGDIPLLGALFRRSEKSQEKVELLIFITPRLIEDSLSLN
ncbi:type IV pilus secretin PilQ [Oceanospirillum linum]|uniref:type IV pilus secretin PilQ n=1 Tax=Oceanospirillum linum TaxID=966 RepID=UPI00089E5690|nr:type IV pilus secretin family protein [Oceanospirillum linum]SEG42312.1 type IV pilus assembly protein PilQ [Oleiphilus messinensis]SMP33179.1 type IV pilus assembly protein PilQ [Oceanospirillum linum]